MKLTRQLLDFLICIDNTMAKILKKTSQELSRLLWNLTRYLDANKVMVLRKIEYISAISTGLSTMANHPKKT